MQLFVVCRGFTASLPFYLKTSKKRRKEQACFFFGRKKDQKSERWVGHANEDLQKD